MPTEHRVRIPSTPHAPAEDAHTRTASSISKSGMRDAQAARQMRNDTSHRRDPKRQLTHSLEHMGLPVAGEAVRVNAKRERPQQPRGHIMKGHHLPEQVGPSPMQPLDENKPERLLQQREGHAETVMRDKNIEGDVLPNNSTRGQVEGQIEIDQHAHVGTSYGAVQRALHTQNKAERANPHHTSAGAFVIDISKREETTDRAIKPVYSLQPGHNRIQPAPGHMHAPRTAHHAEPTGTRHRMGALDPSVAIAMPIESAVDKTSIVHDKVQNQVPRAIHMQRSYQNAEEGHVAHQELSIPSHTVKPAQPTEKQKVSFSDLHLSTHKEHLCQERHGIGKFTAKEKVQAMAEPSVNTVPLIPARVLPQLEEKEESILS